MVISFFTDAKHSKKPKTRNRKSKIFQSDCTDEFEITDNISAALNWIDEPVKEKLFSFRKFEIDSKIYMDIKPTTPPPGLPTAELHIPKIIQKIGKIKEHGLSRPQEPSRKSSNGASNGGEVLNNKSKSNAVRPAIVDQNRSNASSVPPTQKSKPIKPVNILPKPSTGIASNGRNTPIDLNARNSPIPTNPILTNPILTNMLTSESLLRPRFSTTNGPNMPDPRHQNAASNAVNQANGSIVLSSLNINALQAHQRSSLQSMPNPQNHLPPNIRVPMQNGAPVVPYTPPHPMNTMNASNASYASTGISNGIVSGATAPNVIVMQQPQLLALPNNLMPRSRAMSVHTSASEYNAQRLSNRRQSVCDNMNTNTIPPDHSYVRAAPQQYAGQQVNEHPDQRALPPPYMTKVHNVDFMKNTPPPQTTLKVLTPDDLNSRKFLVLE